MNLVCVLKAEPFDVESRTCYPLKVEIAALRSVNEVIEDSELR